MELGCRPRSKTMFSTVKPTKGRKLDAILLKISETSKSDIGDEKHGISPENLSVQMPDSEANDTDNFEKAEFEEQSPVDGSFDLSRRRKATRKGDARRIMRHADSDQALEETDSILEEDASPASSSNSKSNEASPQKNVQSIKRNKDQVNNKSRGDTEVKMNGHGNGIEGDIEDSESVPTEGDGDAANSTGSINTIGERLSLLDAYLYHEGSDDDEGRRRKRDGEKGGNLQKNPSFDSEKLGYEEDEGDLVQQGPVTVFPMEPDSLDSTSENKMPKVEKSRSTSQPPTCNLCGKSFSCISNVYRHKRKVHRKKGGKVLSSNAISMSTVSSLPARSVGHANSADKKSDKVGIQASQIQQPSHHLGREINCELCGKTLTKSNIARHRRLVHFNPNRRHPAKHIGKDEKREGKTATDSRDGVDMKTRKDMKDTPHRDSSNALKNPAPLTTKKIKFSCDICHQVFSCRSNVYRHKRLVHKRSSKEKMGKVVVVMNSNKGADKGVKKDPEADKKRDVKKEKLAKDKAAPEKVKSELPFPMDTPANSMVSLPSYRRSKYVCGVCGLVFMARSTYYRHKKTHRTAAQDIKTKPAEKLESNELKEETTASTPASKSTTEKSNVESKKSVIKDEKKKAPDESSEDNSRAAASSGGNLTVITSGRGKSKFACGLCGQVFPCRSNAYHHRRLAHGKFGPTAKGVKENEVVQQASESTTADNLRWSRRPGSCDICGKIFSCKGNIYRHKRLVHGVDSGGRAMFQDESPKTAPASPPAPSPPLNDKNDSGKYLCDICGNGFSCAGNVQRHKRNVHGMTPTREAYMSNSRAKQLLAKAKSYSTRRAAALGHSHDLRSSGVPLRNCGKSERSRVSQKKVSNATVEETKTAEELNIKIESVRSNSSDGRVSLSKDVKEVEKENSTEPVETNFPCIKCDLRFQRKEDLEAHAESHLVEVSNDKMDDCIDVPVVVTTPESFKCRYCNEVFNESIDLTKHLEKHKMEVEKCNNVRVVECPTQPQQMLSNKQGQGAEFRYVSHPFSPAHGYYPYHNYNGANLYRPCVGYCDGACHNSHLNSTPVRDHESQQIYYNTHGFFGHSHHKGTPHHPEHIYPPGHYEDHPQHFGHRHHEPHFHDAYGRAYRQHSKNNYSPDVRYFESQPPYDIPGDDDYQPKDQKVLQEIIDAHLEEEANISDIYSCLSCSKCFQTRDELDHHSELHASEPLTDINDPNGHEFSPYQSIRPHFHYPQAGFCSQGTDPYSTPVSHRLPPVPQHPPYQIIGPGIPHPQPYVTPRFELSPPTYQSPASLMCSKQKSKVIILDPGSLDEHCNGIVLCCFCGEKYTTKTDLWSHLMRRHGLKSRDARSKVNDCMKQALKVVSLGKDRLIDKETNSCIDQVEGIGTAQENSQLQTEKLPVPVYDMETMGSSAATQTPCEPFDLEVDGTEIVTLHVSPREPEILENEPPNEGCEIIVPNGECDLKATCEASESSRDSSQCLAEENEVLGDQEGSLFNTVCENVMALLNSPDNRKQCESDFLTGGSDENSCASIQEKTVECKDCSITFSSSKQLSLHHRLHHGELPFECQICFRRFRNSFVLRQHRGLHSDLSKHILYCKICDKDFGKVSNYEAHVNCHTDKISSSCTTCGRSFLNRHTLERHQVRHLCKSEPSCRTCQLCKKKYKSRKMFLSHMRSLHLDAKSLYCTYCCRRFKSKATLKSHIKTHVLTRRHFCDICHQPFTSKSDLRDHISVQHECSCVICKKSFSNLSVLERHKVFYHKRKSQRRERRRKRATKPSKTKLKKMVRTSNGKLGKSPPSFSCSICSKKFSSKRNCQRHVKHHNGVSQGLIP